MPILPSRAVEQPQMRENLGHHGEIFDSRKERQRAAAQRTGGEVDGKNAFESLRLTHAGPR